MERDKRSIRIAYKYIYIIYKFKENVLEQKSPQKPL
jgi:hypothetical protein